MADQAPADLELLVVKLREAVDRPEDASDSDNSIGDVQTNRYNKLKRKARFVSRGKLNVVGGIRSDTKQVYYGSKKRSVISNRKTDDLSSDDEDAYHDTFIEEILAPINDPSEVATHIAHRKTFRRQALPTLASHALQAIATEHEHRVQLSRLLTAFLGDDPSLIMERYEADILGTTLQRPTTSETNLGTAEASVPVKAMTRQTAAIEENLAIAGDFITPSYDRNLGLSGDEAEEARRLLQAALDRSEEYLRCMQKVRSGLVKADRYRQRTWRWCKDSLRAAERDETR